MSRSLKEALQKIADDSSCLIAQKIANDTLEALAAQQGAQEPTHDPASAAIQFALDTDEGMAFLHHWNYGGFDVCRRGWPDAPDAVYIRADSMHPATKAPEQPRLTQEMIDAFKCAYKEGSIWTDRITYAVKAMYEAAPEQPATSLSDEH